MADNIPPPHTPIPINSYKVESSTQRQKIDRIEEFDFKKIEIERFIIMASKDPKMHENIFIQIAGLKELMQSGILNADQENILIEELKTLDFELNNGIIKIKDLHYSIAQFNTFLEELCPKVKVFNIVQVFKNDLYISPLDDLPQIEEHVFKNFEKIILSFIKEDVENFKINKLYTQLKTIHKTFFFHPRRNYSETIDHIIKIVTDIQNGTV